MSLSGKWRRLKEAHHLAFGHAVGWRSKLAILRSFASILRSTTDPTEVDMRLRFGEIVRDFRMRKSDVFTLTEILFERQYATARPLPEQPVIVDAGANIGVSALWFLGLRPKATLFAFEPEPENFRLLERNLAGLPGATAVRAALGRTDGTIDLILADHGAVHSTVDSSVGRTTIAVPLLALGRFLEERGVGRIDLLKLDVEGSEAEVVAGLGDRIDDVQMIVGEFHERFVDEASFYGNLRDRGFKLASREHFGGADSAVHTFQMLRRDRRDGAVAAAADVSRGSK